VPFIRVVNLNAFFARVGATMEVLR
jgi:hypothetical protein